MLTRLLPCLFFDSLSSAERARQLRNPEGDVGLAVAAWLNETNRRGSAQILAALGLERQSKVLEIGFGNGRASPDVLASANEGHYAGIDISPTMAEEAKRFNAEFVTSGRAEFHCAAAERMPFPDAMFDRAFSIGVIHFWPEPVVVLKELRLVLKPDGVAIMGGFAPPGAADFARAEFGFYLRDAAAWEGFCFEAGLRKAKAETMEVTQTVADGAPLKFNVVLVEVRA
jgi:ubiquinone/menaquinone biosynthesis C-methylase UbiE